MSQKNVIAIVALLLMAGFSAVSQASSSVNQAEAASSPPCDRECLAGFVTQYLDAMIAHKPEALPLASNARFTEDCKEMKLGEGLWKSISRLTGYRRDILDVREGSAVSYLVVEEAGSRSSLS